MQTDLEEFIDQMPQPSKEDYLVLCEAISHAAGYITKLMGKELTRDNIVHMLTNLILYGHYMSRNESHLTGMKHNVKSIQEAAFKGFVIIDPGDNEIVVIQKDCPNSLIEDLD